MVQERARVDGEMDYTWDHDDHENDLRRISQSPENDFVDVEGHDHRPLSARSGSSQRTAQSQIIPALPEIKRGRGRPRKIRDTVEDGKLINFIINSIRKIIFFIYYLYCIANFLLVLIY